MDLAGGFLDPPEHDRNVALEGRTRAAARFREHRLERGDQALCLQRRRTMLVDDTARCCFERRGERRQSLRDIVVDERQQFWRFVADEKCDYQEKDLRLPLAEIAHELHEPPDVALLLPHDDRRGMFTCAGEPGAIARALNLYQALGATADGADLLAEGRTAAARAPRTAKRTQHSGSIIV